MAKRKIVWTKAADLQFVGVLEYWLNRNKSNSYSKKLVLEVSKRTKQIAENPLIYAPTDFKDIRVASNGNFSIFFKATDKQIVILAFWDNRQDPKKLLAFLKDR